MLIATQNWSFSAFSFYTLLQKKYTGVIFFIVFIHTIRDTKDVLMKFNLMPYSENIQNLKAGNSKMQNAKLFSLQILLHISTNHPK